MPNCTSSTAFAAALAASGLMLASPLAIAEIRCNTNEIAVPQTVDGIYINFATGATGTSSATVPGFDFNPWFSSATSGLNFYMRSDNDANNSAVFDTASPSYRVLAPGTVIGPELTFSGAQANAANMAAWRAGVTGYLGVRFTNESTGIANYGWVYITTTAGTGFPATIHSSCFQDSGDAIGTAITPVSLQSFSID